MSLHKLSTSQPYNVTCKLSSGAFKILPQPVRTDICPALDCSGGFSSGGSRGEALGAPVFWVRNEKNHGRKKNWQGKQNIGLDTPLVSVQTKTGSPIYCVELHGGTVCHQICDKQNPRWGCSSPFHPHVTILIDFIL